MAHLTERPGVSGSGEAESAHALLSQDRSPHPILESDEARPRSDEFNTLVAEIRRRYALDTKVFRSLTDQIRRRLGLAPLSMSAVVLAGVLGLAIRLALVLLITAVVGDWAGIPWSRWILVLICLASIDAFETFSAPPIDLPARPVFVRTIEAWTALLPTVKEETDLRELAEYFRRWTRPVVSLRVGVTVATMMLVTVWLFER